MFKHILNYFPILSYCPVARGEYNNSSIWRHLDHHDRQLELALLIIQHSVLLLYISATYLYIYAKSSARTPQMFSLVVVTPWYLALQVDLLPPLFRKLEKLSFTLKVYGGHFRVRPGPYHAILYYFTRSVSNHYLKSCSLGNQY